MNNKGIMEALAMTFLGNNGTQSTEDGFNHYAK